MPQSLSYAFYCEENAEQESANYRLRPCHAIQGCEVNLLEALRAVARLHPIMKHVSYLVCFVLLGLLGRALPAADKSSDIAELKKGFASYFSMMDQMQAEVHMVRDAKGTANLLDQWTRANQILLNTTLKYKQKYPEAVAAKTPPPELAEEMKKVRDIKLTYGVLTSDLSVLLKTFRKDPVVKAGLERHEKTMKQLRETYGN
jgi:hypothetical protein